MKKSAFVKIIKEMVLEESTRITKKFSKAVEAYKAVEVEMQSLVKDFVAEKDPKKKEDIKNQLKSLTKKKKQAEAAFNAALATEPVKLKESINEGKEVELILSKDENLDRIKKILRTDKKFKDLNLTKWASGRPLGSARGMLVSMYFDDPKERIQDLINTHNIKVANKSMFESVNESKNLKKGDILRLKTGQKLFIVGPKGDGYSFTRGDDRRQKDHAPKGWFDMMISTGKMALVESVNEAWSNWEKGKNLKAIVDISKKNKSKTLLVTDRNNSRIGQFWLKNGKFAKVTVANSGYDFQNNKTSLKDRSDVLYQYKIEESVNEAKKPPTDSTIKPHMNQYSVSDDPYDVAEELGKEYGWSQPQIEKAEKLIRKKYIKESVNEAKEKWVVYDTKTKKRLPNAGKTWATMKAADAFAAKQKNAKVASAEFYFDKIQESVNEGLSTSDQQKVEDMFYAAKDKLGSRYNWKTHLTPIYHDISKKLNLNIDDVSGYLNLVGA